MMDGENLEKVNKIECLGIILDSKISLKENANICFNKMANKLSFLGSIRSNF